MPPSEHTAKVDDFVQSDHNPKAKLPAGNAHQHSHSVHDMMDECSAKPIDFDRQNVSFQNNSSEFIDVKFTQKNQQQVLKEIKQRSEAEPFAYIVTPNVDHVVRIQHSRSDLWPAYRNAWFTLCDSRILGRLARYADISLPIVPGSDLTVALFQEVIEPDDRVVIIGGSETMVKTLKEQYQLTNLVHLNPPMGFINNETDTQAAVNFVCQAQARYTFLAIGSPQQEILAYRILKQGGATGIGFCIGASLQFITEEQARAPYIMQKLSMEWLFRLMSDPKRLWRRYLVEGPMIFKIAHQWKQRRRD